MHLNSRLAAAVSLATAALSSPCALAQPNVLLIISDDAGWADFGFNDQGNGEVPTPALDSIAGRGRWFRAAYTAPVCSPSRARLFLGQHNQRTGYDNNGPNSFDASDSVVQGLTLSDTTLFERMNDAGYHVGYFGKWHLGQERDVVSGNTLVTPGNLPPRHGIDYFLGLTSGSRTYFIGDTTQYQQLLRELTLDPMTGIVVDNEVENNYPANAYMTDILAEEVADYITDRASQPEPFFAIASFTAPHGPLQATQEYFDRADALGISFANANRRTYTAMMIAFDDGVQTILDRLDDPNDDGDTADSLTNDTLIVFINDNGGETANSARNFPLRGKKSDTFDGGIRVMMTMAGPGIPATGASFDFPVDSVDLTPTFLAAAGQPLGPNDFTDGVNLLPYLDGTLTGPPRTNVFVRGNNPITAGVREGDFKLTIENIGGPFLYDIVANPGENAVRNADFPATVEAMTDIMNEFEAEYMKPRWGPTDVNPFDGFVYRPAAAGSGAWSAAGAWAAEGGSPGSATMFGRDVYANLTVRFPTHTAAYTASNDLTRPDGLPAIANAVIFDGTHNGGAAGATIDGQSLMLADTLAGSLPRVTANSTAASGSSPSTIDLELRLWDDLIIDGTGSEPLILAGSIVEERAGRSATFASLAPFAITGLVDLSSDFTLTTGSTSVTGHVSAAPLLVTGTASLAIGDGSNPETPDYIGNRSAIDVTTPAVGGPPLTLAYAGDEIVGSLAIDGVMLPLGTYSASTHPTIFAGPGRLKIRGPLDCLGDRNDDGFATIFDLLSYLEGFDAEEGCGVGAVPLVSGITVNTDASTDTPGDSSWEVTTPGTDLGRAWTFAGAQSPVATDAGAPAGIPLAYEFPAAAASGPDYEDPSRSPSTIEIWFQPDDFAGNQMIWEAGGGSRGGVLWLSGNELRLDVQNGIPTPVRASTTLTAGWHQVVAVIDIDNSTTRLYVDGALRDTQNLGSTDRWAGGNPAGLGTIASSAAGNPSAADFRGQIGIYRAYNANRALSDSEVMDSYNAVISAATPCTDDTDLVNDGLLDSADVLEQIQRLIDCLN